MVITTSAPRQLRDCTYSRFASISEWGTKSIRKQFKNGKEQSKLQAVSALQMFICSLTTAYGLPENMQRLEWYRGKAKACRSAQAAGLRANDRTLPFLPPPQAAAPSVEELWRVDKKPCRDSLSQVCSLPISRGRLFSLQTDRRRIDPTMTIPGQPQKKGSLQMCREFKGHCATKGREHRCKRCSTTESHTACSQPYSFPSNWHVSQPLLVLLSILIILTTACSTTSVLCSYLWAERQSNSAQRQEGTTSTTQWLNMLQKLSPRRRSESFWKEREKKTRTEKQTTKH